MINNIVDIGDWFDGVFREGRTILNDDVADTITNAIARKKKNYSPPTGNMSFRYFTIGDHYPYICCHPVDYDSGYVVDVKAVDQHHLEHDDQIEDLILGDIPEGDFKNDKLLKGASILWLEKRNGRFDASSAKFYHYSYKYGIVKNTLKSPNRLIKARDSIILEETPSKDPFDAAEDKFRNALISVLERDEYKDISGDETKWFSAKRIAHMREFWHDVQKTMPQT